MPVLPDGTYIDEEKYAEMIAQMGGTGIPTSGTVLGTNYNFMPTTSGGGALNLGWDQTPGFGAAVNFDPSAGLENAFISDYDVSGQGMANVGGDTNLSLTAGLQGAGLNRPNAYMDATISDVVPGLTVGAGTDTTPFASYFGDQDSVVPGLGITTTSGGPTDVSYATEVMSLPSGGGVNLNLGTAGGGSGGVTFEGTPSDLGTLGRRVWGGITDALGNIISPAGADASVPEIAVAPTFVEDESAWGAGMAEVSMPGSDFFGGGVDAPFDFADTSRTQDQIDDISRHGGLTFGVPVWTGRLTDLATYIPSQPIREMIRDQHDKIGDFLGDETTTDKLQDLVNNQIAIDIKTANPQTDFTTRLQNKKEFEDNPNTVYDKDSLTAMVELAKKDYYKSEEQVQEAINEIKSGVDTFKDVPTETFFEEAVTPVRTDTISKRELQRQHQERKDALAAQRKSDLARQKAAADAQKEFNRLAAKATQEAAAAQKSAAAQADKAKKDLERFLASRAYQEEGQPVPAHLIDLATQVDTFSGYGGRNGGAAGALGGYRGDPVGREAAIESRGGGRSNGGGGGRGGPGGRGR